MGRWNTGGCGKWCSCDGDGVGNSDNSEEGEEEKGRQHNNI